MMRLRVLLLGLAVLTGSGCQREDPRSGIPGGARATAAPPAPPEATSTAGMISLRDWMKGNAASAIAANDSARLASVFEHIAVSAPAGFDGWADIAHRGRESATRADFDQAREACKACHDAFRARYRQQHQ